MKTDAQLQQDVVAELKWDDAVVETHIGVRAQDGVVTLSGQVASCAEKWTAERAAQRVAGVRGLAVELEVVLAGSDMRSDADIAHSAENVLSWMTHWSRDAIKVMVEDGWITLTGEVNRLYLQQTATDAIRHLMGVRGVSNQITVKHATILETLQADIQATLKRRSKADISVDVEEGHVTLSGSVHHWSERDMADQAAWGTAGVQRVSNHILVVD